MAPIILTKEDLVLINDLGRRKYKNNTLKSNATLEEQASYKEILNKMRMLAEYFKVKYERDFGPFEVGAPTGNPIAIGGTTLKNIWSGLYKGNTNKQYAAQIMFHLNRDKMCLNVGFAFGSASSHHLDGEEKNKLEKELERLGIVLHSSIEQNQLMRETYDTLFELGFEAYCNSDKVLSDEWLRTIQTNPEGSNIIRRIYPNQDGIIETSEIDSDIISVIPLMCAFDKYKDGNKKTYKKPLTPEQYAKQAERRAYIGMKGELFIMDQEEKKLSALKIRKTGYPEHVSLISNNFGYDILSLNEKQEDLLIEVKTTTIGRGNPKSREFNISAREYNTYEENKEKYKLYRVYDIEGNPESEEIDLSTVIKEPDGYLIKY
jgi:hypothetical protein